MKRRPTTYIPCTNRSEKRPGLSVSFMYKFIRFEDYWIDDVSSCSLLTFRLMERGGVRGGSAPARSVTFLFPSFASPSAPPLLRFVFFCSHQAMQLSQDLVTRVKTCAAWAKLYSILSLSFTFKTLLMCDDSAHCWGWTWSQCVISRNLWRCDAVNFLTAVEHPNIWSGKHTFYFHCSRRPIFWIYNLAFISQCSMIYLRKGLKVCPAALQ